MLRLLEFMTGFYWILIPQFLIENLIRGRWRRAYRAKGYTGLVQESVTSLVGLNSVPFYVPIDGQWSGYAISRLLKRHNIDMWGWGFAFNEMFFHVHRDDAWDAQQILLQAGVELRG